MFFIRQNKIFHLLYVHFKIIRILVKIIFHDPETYIKHQ